MIDIGLLKYTLYLVPADGKKIALAGAQSVTREENPGELAQRLTANIYEPLMSTAGIASKIALGAYILLNASVGGPEFEVFRGPIWDFEDNSTTGKEMTITCYDPLIYLQKSQDNKLFKSGLSSKAMLTEIFANWNVPVGVIEADVKLGKKVYKNENISDMVMDILSDVKKQGGGKFVVRYANGKVNIVKRGANTDIYHFEGDTIQSNRDKFSLDELVTRVKIVGKEKTEAIVNGKTDFGILQKIYSRPQDETLAAAKKSAQEIIDDKGKPSRTTTIASIDVPTLRKGDKVHIANGRLNGYFCVNGVSHDANKKSMAMEVEE